VADGGRALILALLLAFLTALAEPVEQTAIMKVVNAGEFDTALGMLEQDLEAAGDDRNERVHLLWLQGHVLALMGLDDRAEVSIRLAIETGLTPAGQEAWMLLVMPYAELSSVLYRRGDTVGASKAMGEALRISSEVGFKAHQQQFHNNMGIYLMRSGEHEQAMTAFERSIAHAGPDDPAGGAHNHWAEAAYHLKLYDESFEQYSLAVGDPRAAAEAHLGLARIARERGDWRQSRTEAERSLAAARHVSSPIGVAQALWSTAKLLDALNDAEGALPLREEAFELVTETLPPEAPLYATALNDLGVNFAQLNRYDEAREKYERSIELRSNESAGELVLTMQNLAIICVHQGEMARARQLYEDALTLALEVLGEDDRQVVTIRMNYSFLLLRLGEVEAARVQAEAGYEVALSTLGPDHAKTTGIRRNLGLALSLAGEIERARELFKEEEEGAYRLVIAQAPFISERASLSFLHRQRSALGLLLWHFDRPGDEQFAYESLLRWQGAASEIQRNRGRIVRSHADPEVQRIGEELRALRREIAALTYARAVSPETAGRLNDLTNAKESAERKLATATATGFPAPLTAAEVCAAVPEGAALVHYSSHGVGVPSDTVYTAFVLRGGQCDHIVRIHLGDAHDVVAGIEKYTDALERDDALSRFVDRRGQLVRERLWDPVAEATGDAQQVLIIPHGRIANVAFGGLLDRGGRYLVEDITFGYLDRSADLVRFSEAKNALAADRALLVGDVEFARDADGVGLARGPCGDVPLHRLPGTAVEIDRIGAILRRQKFMTREYRQGDPTETTMNEQVHGNAVLHLATHGFYAGDKCGVATSTENLFDRAVGLNPMLLSGIVLAPSDDEFDGIWTAEEVSGLDLDGTRLVVMSACQTGMGKTSGGDGLMGLRRAFGMAGAETLVFTLWSVRDEAAAAVMIDFYEALFMRRSEGIARSLRAAKLARLAHNRREYGQGRPQDWAGYVTSGDWR